MFTNVMLCSNSDMGGDSEWLVYMLIYFDPKLEVWAKNRPHVYSYLYPEVQFCDGPRLKIPKNSIIELYSIAKFRNIDWGWHED